ncbi:MAG: tRNA (adenosine(37)-N6)-threonylcarbamoyltransferase complex ATPase subunit type 1 TsaE [Alphaproteobacteria bacterium]
MNAQGSALEPNRAGADGYARRFDLPDAASTVALGAALAPHLRRGDLLALAGDLGAGKTTLARGLIGGLGYGGPVPSPTFTLVQHYETDPVPVWHFDLYRIGHPDEVVELGFDDARAEGIVLLEWAERLGADLPATRLDVQLDYAASGQTRVARLSGPRAWAERLHDLHP